ncbi:hypothetical protein DOTSEDRAFT_68213 [Dothistroma septosporum NZE10]|uniref:Uncharacterized protein n=1 Tax=Dothistroma septosporum (strain NZE10 / CBS 128990) TaxID=675120 RepID=N1Q479_DOTSN|nr:hypothetical protein DOTSEDRAFT_68213 [Dothistroma septosporum NZE10]
MPPIQVHIDDPITPKKAEGMTPRTSEAATPPSAAEASTTQARSQYPAARPGAAAVPAATPYAPQPGPQPTPTRIIHSSSNDAPPPPQPGEAPVPFGTSTPVTATLLPPPPKAGEPMPVTTMPAQMGVSSPQHNYKPTHSTSTYSPLGRAGGPTTVNFGAVPAPTPTIVGSHPPGYHQNVDAQEMSSAQRASLDAEQRRGSFAPGLGMGGNDSNDFSAGSVWNTMKTYANFAGNKLAETEKEVWKRINKD